MMSTMTVAQEDGREPTSGEWLTIKEVAALLGVTPDTVRSQIMRGHLQARHAHPRKLLLHRAEVERYRQEHLGRFGWDQRHAPDYTPSKYAARFRRYYERKKARAQRDHNEEQP